MTDYKTHGHAIDILLQEQKKLEIHRDELRLSISDLESEITKLEEKHSALYERELGLQYTINSLLGTQKQAAAIVEEK